VATLRELLLLISSRGMQGAIVESIKTIVLWDTKPPPALTWVLRNDRLTIACLAALSAAIWYLSEPIIVTYDTFAYLNAAKFIAGLEDGSLTYFRPPLLPLLLAVTGVPAHQTYFWFILTQLVLGIAAVVLMHDCLGVISRSLGLIGAALFIATFMAFVHYKSIMTEEIYLSDGACASTVSCHPALATILQAMLV
jgi:hypothetical protein